jgi:hypothetical protein
MCGRDDGDECYEAGHRELFTYDTFPHALAGFNTDVKTGTSFGHGFLTAGWASCFGTTNHTQNSYGGHGRFREDLAALSGWPSEIEVPRTKSNFETVLKDFPFWELIWFADNEGTLGPVACENLAGDFEMYYGAAAREFTYGLDHYKLDHYKAWHNSVRIAATTGLIHFH